MTTSQDQIYPDAAATLASDARYRNLASAIALFLGAYLVISSLSSVLINQLLGYAVIPEILVMLILQLLFAMLVVIVGFFLSTATVSSKLIASAIFVVGVVMFMVLQISRLNGTIGGGVVLASTLANPYFMTVLVVGAGWLLVRGARLGWLGLLLSLILIPVPTIFNLQGVGAGVTQIVVLLLCAIIGLAIVAVGRPLRG